MPTLAYTPSPGGYADILHALIPRWVPYFDAIVEWAQEAPPRGGITHTWSIGTLPQLAEISDRIGGSSDRITYAYAIIDTPFVAFEHAELVSKFDFFVTMSPLAHQAYRNALLSPHSRPSKAAFIGAKNMGVIPPGVDLTIFRPSNIHSGEFSKEELRNALFGTDSTSQDFLVLIAPGEGLPDALATVRLLKERANFPVKAYVDAPLAEILPQILGNDLEPGIDVLTPATGSREWTPEQQARLLKSVDLVLCTDLRVGWPFELTYAMACGTVVAAPDEHVWLDVVDDGRGIALPAVRFAPAPWNPTEYCRSIDPSWSADLILAARNEPDKWDTIRETGLQWAHHSTEASWDRIADGWLKLFGVK